MLRHGHRVVTGVTLGLCGVALLLLLKPAAQAWRLGRARPAQLTAAYGPAIPPQRTPFSVTASPFASAPQEVGVRTME